MKSKNKGRKIYKTKEKNYYGKTPFGKFMSVALTVLLIGGIGVLGYSVAGPLIDFSKRKGDDNISATDEGSSLPPEATQAVTAATVDMPENISADEYKIYSLGTDDISGEDALVSALAAVDKSKGYEYICVPLKTAGGDIQYASEVKEAQLSGAVRSGLTLSAITAEIRECGFKSVAEINLLNDYVAPATYPDMSYLTQDDGSRWIDRNGKYWLSPFSDKTVEYLGNIADEVASGGFDAAICCGVVFPPFSDNDKALLGDSVTDPGRYMALTSLTNLIYSKLIAQKTSVMVEISALDIIEGNADILQPMLLDPNTVVLDINFDEYVDSVIFKEAAYTLPADAPGKAVRILELVKPELEQFNVVVRLSGRSFTPEEILEAKDAVAEQGYGSFMIG